MRHTCGLLSRAVSMVVQLETYGPEARFWIAPVGPRLGSFSGAHVGEITCRPVTKATNLGKQLASYGR
jgi:hypothetical protein